MRTPLAANVLTQVLDWRGWTQVELAAKAGFNQSVVSWHLSRRRPIRDDHLVAYLATLNRSERQMLLAAWIRDTVPSEIIGDVFDVQVNRIREEVASWSPGLEPEEKEMVAWWARQLSTDRELAAIFRTISVRAGWKSPNG